MNIRNYIFASLLVIIILSSVAGRSSALFTGGCPTVSMPQSGFSISGPIQIQPGAYTQLAFGAEYTFPSVLGSPLDGYDACDQSNYPSPSCPVYIVAQPASVATCPDSATIGPEWIDLRANPPSGYAYDQAWSCGGSAPYNQYTSNHDGTCIVNPYYGADLVPGYYRLCVYMGVEPESTSNPYKSSNPACNGFQWFQVPSTTPQYLLISPSVQPNTQSAPYSLNPAKPLTLTINRVTGSTLAQSTLFYKGDTMQVSLQGDGQYPTYLEMADPQAGIYCTYGGVTSTQSQYAPGTVASGDKLSICPNYAPKQSDLPCVIAYSGGPFGAPTAGNPTPETISTGNLAANTYSICGYEGNPPNLNGGSSSTDTNPWPVFFTEQDVIVQCPPSNPTCNNNNLVLPGPNLEASLIQSELCNAYYGLNALLALLALTLMIIGGIVYGAGNAMPGQTKGTIQAYGMGLVLAGAISLVIVTVSVFALSVATNATVSNILQLNACSV